MRTMIIIICFVLLVMQVGECDRREKEMELSSRKPYKWQYDLGKETRESKPTRTLKFRQPSRSDYITKEEFYEGLEDAEMKGMADDPSAQDIYDEFNRGQGR